MKIGDAVKFETFMNVHSGTIESIEEGTDSCIISNVHDFFGFRPGKVRIHLSFLKPFAEQPRRMRIDEME